MPIALDCSGLLLCLEVFYDDTCYSGYIGYCVYCGLCGRRDKDYQSCSNDLLHCLDARVAAAFASPTLNYCQISAVLLPGHEGTCVSIVSTYKDVSIKRSDKILPTGTDRYRHPDDFDRQT